MSAFWKDKGCANLQLPSSAIAVYSIPTTASTSVANGNVNVHITKLTKVFKMDELDESVVWREARRLVTIKTSLVTFSEVFGLEEQQENLMMRLKSKRKCFVILFQPHTV